MAPVFPRHAALIFVRSMDTRHPTPLNLKPLGWPLPTGFQPDAGSGKLAPPVVPANASVPPSVLGSTRPTANPFAASFASLPGLITSALAGIGVRADDGSVVLVVLVVVGVVAPTGQSPSTARR